MTDDPIRWLADERPAAPPPGAASTARARAALIAHAEAGRPATARSTAPLRAPRGDRRWLRPSRVLALAAVAGVATVAAVGIPAITQGDGPLAVPEATAAPLIALSERVADQPAPAGDATLVLRRHRFPDAPGFTGADLYLDDGRYYYADTEAGLRAAVAADERQTSSVARVISEAAAAASPDLPLATARARMIAATWGSSTPVPAAEQPPAVAARATALEALAADPVRRAPTQRESDDNRLWIACMDALQAAAGRTDVRVGALRLLAGVETVTVDTTTVAGRTALVVTSTGFGDDYRESLAVDASTGIPFRFEGGYPGERPSVVIDYSITRATASRL